MLYQSRKVPRNSTVARGKAGVFCLLTAVGILHIGQRARAAVANVRQPGRIDGASRLAGNLLRRPGLLRLVGTAQSEGSFFFRVQAHPPNSPTGFAMLVAHQKGKSAVVLYGSNGRVYAYFGPRMLVFVDVRRPGVLDVFRGVSAGLAFGARGRPGRHLTAFGCTLAPMASGSGFVGFDLASVLQMASQRATRTAYFAADRTLSLSKGASTLTLTLSAPDRSFPIVGSTISSRQGNLAITDISPNAKPLRKLFGVTLAALRASGRPLQVSNYRVGEPLIWFPPPNFGSNQGEIQASEALEQLMPVDENRVRAEDERWINAQIVAMQKSSPSDYGLKAGLRPMIRIFSTMEWGLHKAVDMEAQRMAYVLLQSEME